MIDLKDKRVWATGGSSMVGGEVVKVLRSRGALVFAPTHTKCELLIYDNCVQSITNFRPHYTIHCAGFNGGIHFNKKFPSDIYVRTAQMALNVLHSCMEYQVEKVVSVLPSCAYAALTRFGEPKQLLHEVEFLDGRPHPSVECHGFAKRILFEYSNQIS